MSELVKILPQTLIDFKVARKRFACITAYDTLSAKIAEQAGIELILVGDSVGTTVLGLDTTEPVTMENMLYHTKAVRRGITKSLLAADLPFEGSQGSPKDIGRHARRFMEEAGAEAVKIEGPVFDTIREMVRRKIPVIGHLGLLPQTAAKTGGLKVRAKTEEEAAKLLEDAKKIEQCGAFALVLECIPYQLAKRVTEALKIPTIGIGAGPDTDGQILVWHDVLGFDSEKRLKFVRRYFDFATEAEKALINYRQDVLSGSFPSLSESFTMELGTVPKIAKKGQSLI